jgi:hypothetical protein
VAVEDDLIWYLTWRVREEEGTPIKTRLVKLLYLVDLHNMAVTGRQATSFRWIYYHYGPYAPAIEEVFGRQDGDTIATVENSWSYGDRIQVFRPIGDPDPGLLPPLLKGICDRVCREWALVDLGELLDYVYFETAPMQRAHRRGELLNLDVIREQLWPVEYRALDPPELEVSLSQKVSLWRSSFEMMFPHETLRPYPDYSVRSRSLEEDLPDPLLRGKLRFVHDSET